MHSPDRVTSQSLPNQPCQALFAFLLLCIWNDTGLVFTAKRNYREKKWNRCDAAELANPAHAVLLCCEQRFRFKAILILDSQGGEERSNNIFLELFKAKSQTSLHKCTPAGDAGREGSSAEATTAQSGSLTLELG